MNDLDFQENSFLLMQEGLHTGRVTNVVVDSKQAIDIELIDKKMSFEEAQSFCSAYCEKHCGFSGTSWCQKDCGEVTLPAITDFEKIFSAYGEYAEGVFSEYTYYFLDHKDADGNVCVWSTKEGRHGYVSPDEASGRTGFLMLHIRKL